MKRKLTLLATLALASWAAPITFAQNMPENNPGRVDLVAQTEALSPEKEKAAFKLPPGFEAQLVAAEPDVHKPMNLAFDDLGRLWVTSSLEYPFPAPEGQTGRDQVLIFSDFAPDGRARKRQVFAEGLNIPIGLLPLTPNEALVHSIPCIWRLTDTDGDGKADKKEKVYEQYGQRDTHGMTNAFTWGYDGWIYACHGFNNDSTIKASDGSTISLSSGNTYRMRADGSHVERHTNGQVNPFGIAQDLWGNLFTSDCHSKPIYQLLKGSYYPSFGKPHDGMGFGPGMINHDHYSTGIAGIAIDTGSQFPEEYRGRAWIGNVVTSRINHDRFVRTGGTFDAVELPDFLVSNDPWFRPVDLKFGPDGALYVADFYNRIIGHYEVPLLHPGRDRERGRIWRIVYTGDKAKASDSAKTDTMATTDWTKATPEELIKALSHPNMVIRVKATNQLAARGGEAVVPALSAIIAKPIGEENAKRHAMWVLHRMGKLSSTQLAALGQDPDATIRTHAQRILADKPHHYDGWQSLAYSGLKDTDGMVRRTAAESLGQGPRAEQVGPLLAALADCPPADTHQLHVIRMAIRDHLREPAILSAVSKKEWSADQKSALADCALGAGTAQAAGFVAEYLTKQGNGPRRDEMAGFVARYGSDADLAGIVGWGEKSLSAADQIALARAVAQGRQAGGKPPLQAQKTWTSALVRSLINQNTPQAGNQLTAATELAALMGLTDLAEPIIAVGRDAGRADAVRVTALESATKLSRDRAVQALSELMADASQKATMRDQAAAILGRLGQADVDKVLVAQIATAPARLQQAIAVALVQRPAGAETLLAAVESGKASARLLKIRPVENKLKQTNLRDRDRRMTAALKGIPDADDRITAAIAERKSFINSHRGSAEAGQAIFTKNCATCHQIGTQGARIGPQLDGVGVRGVDRLLEDILDPNRNVDQAFRSTTIATKEGQVLTGLLLRDEGAVLVLADSQGRDVRVPKGEVAEQTVNPLSPMPANWADAMTPEELANLLSYLLEQKKVKAILPDLK
jgi:putative heme-binding domain-containing protein